MLLLHHKQYAWRKNRRELYKDTECFVFNKSWNQHPTKHQLNHPIALLFSLFFFSLSCPPFSPIRASLLSLIPHSLIFLSSLLFLLVFLLSLLPPFLSFVFSLLLSHFCFSPYSLFLPPAIYFSVSFSLSMSLSFLP